MFQNLVSDHVFNVDNVRRISNFPAFKIQTNSVCINAFAFDKAGFSVVNSPIPTLEVPNYSGFGYVMHSSALRNSVFSCAGTVSDMRLVPMFFKISADSNLGGIKSYSFNDIDLFPIQTGSDGYFSGIFNFDTVSTVDSAEKDVVCGVVFCNFSGAAVTVNKTSDTSTFRPISVDFYQYLNQDSYLR